MRFVYAIPAVIFVVFVIGAGGGLFALTMAAVGVLAMAEFFRMAPETNPYPLVAFGAAVAMVAAGFFAGPAQILLVGVAFFPVMFAFAAARASYANTTLAMAFTTLAIVWIGLPVAHAVMLRELDPHGGALLVDVLVATFLADTSAYFGGRLFGRNKLAPRISPNKTIEGLLCGFVGGTLGFWFAGLYQDWLLGTEALVMGAAVAALAPIGDLFSSMLKRDLDVKDTGTLFGPHGGLLDRIDAALFTVVAGYYLAVAYGF